MSHQLQWLKNIIGAAQTGNGAALELLRDVCVEAAKAAPVYDLIAIGQCLVGLGQEASRTEAGRN